MYIHKAKLKYKQMLKCEKMFLEYQKEQNLQESSCNEVSDFSVHSRWIVIVFMYFSFKSSFYTFSVVLSSSPSYFLHFQYSFCFLQS